MFVLWPDLAWWQNDQMVKNLLASTQRDRNTQILTTGHNIEGGLQSLFVEVFIPVDLKLLPLLSPTALMKPAVVSKTSLLP